MPSAEQTQDWDKEKWIDAFSRSTEKPGMEYREDQNGTIGRCRRMKYEKHETTLFFFSRL